MTKTQKQALIWAGILLGVVVAVVVALKFSLLAASGLGALLGFGGAKAIPKLLESEQVREAEVSRADAEFALEDNRIKRNKRRKQARLRAKLRAEEQAVDARGHKRTKQATRRNDQGLIDEIQRNNREALDD